MRASVIGITLAVCGMAMAAAGVTKKFLQYGLEEIPQFNASGSDLNLTPVIGIMA